MALSYKYGHALAKYYYMIIKIWVFIIVTLGLITLLRCLKWSILEGKDIDRTEWKENTQDL